MAKQSTASGSFVRRFWIVPVVLVCLVVAIMFGPTIVTFLESNLTQKSVPNGPVVTTPTVAKPLPVTQFCVDTPPLYPASLGKQAASALADKIDASIVPGFVGLQLYSSYISGHSYQDETGVAFSLPSVAAYPLAPAKPVYGNDVYHNAQLKKAYEKAVAQWQATITAMQKQLVLEQQAVKQQTDRLRALNFPYNNKAADVFGCLADAFAHFQHAPAGVAKQLIIASDLVNNSTQQELGKINLAGVVVTVVFFTCSDSAAACQARTSSWGNLVRRAGAKSFSVFDVAQSQPFPVAL